MIRSFTDILQQVKKTDPILLLYSGGLDGTYLIARLKEEGYKNLVAFHANIEGGADTETVVRRAEALDIKLLIPDLTDEFVSDYVLSAIYCHAKYLCGHPLSASLSRPLIAKHAAAIGERLSAGALLHTSNSSQNSLRRFNQSLADLRYKGLFGSPFEQTHVSRLDKLAFLADRNMAFNLQAYSEDCNIWCREFEYGDYDNVEAIHIPEDAYVWTRKSSNLETENVTIGFSKGLPVSLNGDRLAPVTIILSIRRIAGKYGIGRVTSLEEIATGEKVLEVRETPAAILLMDAYRNLELATIAAGASRVKIGIEQVWVNEASEGRWFGALRNACEQFCHSIASSVSGSVSYLLSENNFQLVSVKSDYPNYISNRDSFESRQ